MSRNSPALWLGFARHRPQTVDRAALDPGADLGIRRLSQRERHGPQRRPRDRLAVHISPNAVTRVHVGLHIFRPRQPVEDRHALAHRHRKLWRLALRLAGKHEARWQLLIAQCRREEARDVWHRFQRGHQHRKPGVAQQRVLPATARVESHDQW